MRSYENKRTTERWYAEITVTVGSTELTARSNDMLSRFEAESALEDMRNDCSGLPITKEKIQCTTVTQHKSVTYPNR